MDNRDFVCEHGRYRPDRTATLVNLATEVRVLPFPFQRYCSGCACTFLHLFTLLFHLVSKEPTVIVSLSVDNIDFKSTCKRRRLHPFYSVLHLSTLDHQLC